LVLYRPCLIVLVVMSDSEDETEVGCCGCVEEKKKAYSYQRCGNSSTASAIVAVCRYFEVYDDEDAGCGSCFFDQEETDGQQFERRFDTLEMFVAFFIYLIGFLTQAFLAFFFYKYWVEVKGDPYEPEYYSQMEIAVDNATSLNMSMLTAGTPMAGEAIKHCFLNRAPPILHIVALLIWFGVGLNKISDVIYLIYCVCQLKSEESEDEKKEKRRTQAAKDIDPPPGERKVKVVIDWMSSRGKRWIFFLILLPELILAVFIAHAGAEYISVVGEVNLLVKASLKMNFIARLDKMIQPSYVSYNWEDYVRNSVFKVDDPIEGWKDGAARTIGKVILGIGLAAIYTIAFYPQVEFFRSKCDTYYQMFPHENVMSQIPPIPVMRTEVYGPKGMWPWYPLI